MGKITDNIRRGLTTLKRKFGDGPQTNGLALNWTAKDLSSIPVEHQRLAIGTHHKSGTIWLRTVFEGFARLTEASFIHSQLGKITQGSRRTIYFDTHSRFEGVDLTDVRGLHMVRDPRDLIISAMHYHRKSEEPWLHKPRFDGLTYQEKINTYDDVDAMLFEIDNSVGNSVQDMVSFSSPNGNCRTIRYEDFMVDIRLERWRDALEWLGLQRLDMIIGLNSVYQNSLFGGRRTGGHVRSGKVAQWKTELPDKVLARFYERFPNAARDLGYEQA